jgi:hypothetical protein
VRLIHVMAARGFRIVVAALVGVLSGVPGALAQAPQGPPPPPPAGPVQAGAATTQPPPKDQTETQAELARIKEALKAPPALNLDSERLRFYLEIYARQPTFDQFMGSYDLLHGPVKRAAMTHQEFLNQVTPQLMNSSAGIRATEMLQFALVNALGQTLIKKAIEEMRNARTQAEVDAIRARIDKELAALKGNSGGS